MHTHVPPVNLESSMWISGPSVAPLFDTAPCFLQRIYKITSLSSLASALCENIGVSILANDILCNQRAGTGLMMLLHVNIVHLYGELFIGIDLCTVFFTLLVEDTL